MLSPGQRLGPYEVSGPLGAGGMGEVYRARDPRLGRDVAIKALPAAFAQDPERLARFEREARLLAALHHPNIAGIHGLEEVDGHSYLILELVEGPTLDERIKRAPLPVDEALEIARQIALALEAAHEAGIIHRDLKPANIKITPAGQVKVLDFGLAKSIAGTSASAASDVDLSHSPTVTATSTEMGVVLGTAPYMSPEQARGRVVDKRADIWSFGCVLYECLTGRRLFTGETVTDIIAAIVRSEPDFTALPAATPVRVRALLARCLRKDAKDRLRDIGDARIELSEVLAGDGDAAPAPRRPPVPAPVFALCVLIGAVLGAGALWWMHPRPQPIVRRLKVEPKQTVSTFFTGARISHDGRQIIYQTHDGFFLRNLNQFASVPIPAGAGSNAHQWSDDDKTIAFTQQGRLKILSMAGGDPITVCTLPDPGHVTGLAWLGRDRILFTMFRGGMYVVPVSGGEPKKIADHGPDEEDLHVPNVLPDGKHVLVVGHAIHSAARLSVFSVEDGTRRDIWSSPRLSAAQLTKQGYLLLLYYSPSHLMAVPFDAARARVTGAPVRVLPHGGISSVSDDGTLVCEINESGLQRALVETDEHGNTLRNWYEPQPGLINAHLSPDGHRVAYVADSDDAVELRILDLASGTRTRLMSSDHVVLSIAWSSDGKRIFYSGGVGRDSLGVVMTDGSGTPVILGRGIRVVAEPGGDHVVFELEREGGHTYLARGATSGAWRPEPVWPQDKHDQGAASFSPDGRWLAYRSDVSGADQVYVRNYPVGEHRQMVSLSGGDLPFWSRKGDQVYFTNDDTLFTASFHAGTVGAPRALFLRSVVGGGTSTDISEGPAGHLLVSRGIPNDPSRGILLIENWAEELKRK